MAFCLGVSNLLGAVRFGFFDFRIFRFFDFGLLDFGFSISIFGFFDFRNFDFRISEIFGFFDFRIFRFRIFRFSDVSILGFFDFGLIFLLILKKHESILRSSPVSKSNVLSSRLCHHHHPIFSCSGYTRVGWSRSSIPGIDTCKQHQISPHERLFLGESALKTDLAWCCTRP